METSKIGVIEVDGERSLGAFMHITIPSAIYQNQDLYKDFDNYLTKRSSLK